ncbi:hypothetical protein D2T29_05720 [Sinirhodobacter populi]|uniref:DUF4114 domain-containing protein n=1 Tax=Paenirhodobacter populi TaxID=2306993 RepID=A0A443KLR1_9RHOB|nr:DUF4114 domain-containing protein [Sinirhodobacter populi]RWR33762.1 hypothetical protein D2T29_05720 [Sinirhodobacter populi]
MFKTILAASAIAFATLPAAAATLSDYIPADQYIGGHIYVASAGEVTVTYIGSEAAFTNVSYFAKDGSDQLLFTNVTAGQGTISLGSFAAGTELVFSMTSIGGGNVHSFLTGTEYAKAGEVDGYGFVVAFEDTINGDADYNDLVFSVSNVSSTLPAVPVPAALPLIASAFGGLLVLRRRRRA